MIPFSTSPPPLLFNPLKHHLGYVREFTETCTLSGGFDKKQIPDIIKSIGCSVTDVYSGRLGFSEICGETIEILANGNYLIRDNFTHWTGTRHKDFKTIMLSDKSEWVIKYFQHEVHWAHIFPARKSRHTFRIKANSLKSAILYQIFVAKDYVTQENLNAARAAGQLSPVRNISDSGSIIRLIELLRN